MVRRTLLVVLNGGDIANTAGVARCTCLMRLRLQAKQPRRDLKWPRRVGVRLALPGRQSGFDGVNRAGKSSSSVVALETCCRDSWQTCEGAA